MDEDYNFEGRSEQEVLLSFTAKKGHRMRQYKKITKLLASRAEILQINRTKLLQAVSALERYQDRLNIFASWLNLHTLESAGAHVTEAETLATATETLVNKVIEQVHEHEPPEADMILAQQAPQAQHTASKPVMALKPDKLSFDGNLGTV